jgi:H+/Cl- antiporter ClcA
VQGIFVLFGSALLTYLAGVPLGNEGPSVQMGTALGKGGSSLLGKKQAAWERYLMTGGAGAGFAIATGAPLSGILFALEEAHRRFSTTLFAVAGISVLMGTLTHRALSLLFDVDTTFFDLEISQVLPLKYFWVALLVGAVCGLCSLLFTWFYRVVQKMSKPKHKTLGLLTRFVLIFAVTAVLGFFSADFIGSGHSLIENILHGKTVWYMLLLAFFARALVMIYANCEGVCGGIFLPTLAFGAMIASLLSDGLVALGLVEGQYATILIVVGMASFLAASARTPITAIVFAAEALCVTSNILPVLCGVAVSFLIAEISGKASFTDTVIARRVEAARHGKTPIIVYSHMTVQKDSFADGMEIRDILWPPTCTVLSIDRKQSGALHHDAQEIREGDELHLHYQTYDPDETLNTMTAILGEQPENQRSRSHTGSDAHRVPLD